MHNPMYRPNSQNMTSNTTSYPLPSHAWPSTRPPRARPGPRPKCKQHETKEV